MSAEQQTEQAVELELDLLRAPGQDTISPDLPGKLSAPFQRSPRALDQAGAVFGFFPCHLSLQALYFPAAQQRITANHGSTGVFLTLLSNVFVGRTALIFYHFTTQEFPLP